MKVKKDLKKIRENLLTMYPFFEVNEKMEKIEYIQQLKKEKDVVSLGHNYMTPDVFYGASDIVGDSLFLAKEASKLDSKIILVNGVYFMAETTKVLNSDKMVLIADKEAGCSLAESITAEDIKTLKAKYPERPVICYVNCTAEVKAECDICCTSSNAMQVVNSFKDKEIIFVPDKYLAKNVAKSVDKKIIAWENGTCVVHELYTAEDIKNIKKQYEGDVVIISHPECNTDVTDNSDFMGSTSQMEDFIASRKEKNVFLITECGMSDNLRNTFKNKNFISTCNTCPFMKKINLDKIIKTLETLDYQIELEEEIIKKAKQSIINMINLN